MKYISFNCMENMKVDTLIIQVLHFPILCETNQMIWVVSVFYMIFDDFLIISRIKLSKTPFFN